MDPTADANDHDLDPKENTAIAAAEKEAAAAAAGFSPNKINHNMLFLPRIWTHLHLPQTALSSVHLSGKTHALPSSFPLAQLAQESIALSGLAASMVYSLCVGGSTSTGAASTLASASATVPASASASASKIPTVHVSLHHASLEFQSEKLYTLAGKGMPNPWTIGGLYPTSDGGCVRIHDAFLHHRRAALEVLGLLPLGTGEGKGEEVTKVTREDVASKTKLWCAIDLETTALGNGAVIYALRTAEQFSQLPASHALSPSSSSSSSEGPPMPIPIRIRKISSGPPTLPSNSLSGQRDKALRGFRVLELSRVIAAPVAGRALAAHGADVLWITSPKLPTLPALDIDFSRGKRGLKLDLNLEDERGKLRDLGRTADVFLQSYRPGSLAARGLGPEEVCSWNDGGMVYANLSAWGPEGPWRQRRGFDSLVQTAMGFNVAEGEAWHEFCRSQDIDESERGGGGRGDKNSIGEEEKKETTPTTPKARPFPAQALDHAAGYFLATGIMAALYRRATEGGSYVVDVSLAGVGQFLKSLPRVSPQRGFGGFEKKEVDADVGDLFFEELMEETEVETKEEATLRAVRHAASVEGLSVGYESALSVRTGVEWLEM